MEPFMQTKLGVLYCGNAIKVLSNIRERAKLLVADFPYKVGNFTRNEYLEWAKRIIKHFGRLTRLDGFILIINNPYNIFYMSQYLQQFRLLNEIILVKNNPHKEEGRFPFMHNTALLLTKRKIFLENDVDMLDVVQVEIGYELDGVRHPAAISEDFFEKVISATTNEGDLVIDVFTGSGTVPVVCERLHRRWIGIEIKPKFCEMTLKRVAGL